MILFHCPGSKLLDDLGPILFAHAAQAWANVRHVLGNALGDDNISICGAAFPWKKSHNSVFIKSRKEGRACTRCASTDAVPTRTLYISARVLRNSVDVAKITRIDDVQAHEILTLRPDSK